MAKTIADNGETSSMEKGANTYSIEKKESGSFDFGGDSMLPPPPSLSLAEERKLYRKIDLRLMPILSLMYLCSFLDRGSCNYLLL